MKNNCNCDCEQKSKTNLKFGRYDDCPTASYKGYVRLSNYLTLSDDTKLAYDLYKQDTSTTTGTCSR